MMVFYFAISVLLFQILLPSDFSAACLYEFEGLDASITIYSDVLRGQAAYKFNITENGTVSGRTATMNTATSLFSLDKNIVLVNNCPPADTNIVLELAIPGDIACSPRYLNISVEAATPMFDMCTNAEVVYNVVEGYVHFMPLNLRNNHRCARFLCYASLTNLEERFEIIIYHWIIKTNASNEIILGKVYSLIVACYEDSQTFDDRHSIRIDIRFTNTSTSKCYSSVSTLNTPTTTPFATVSTFEDIHASSPKVKEAKQLSLSTSLTDSQLTSTVLASLVLSSDSEIKTKPTSQNACCSDNAHVCFQAKANLVVVILVSCFGAIGAIGAGIYMFGSRAYNRLVLTG